MPAILHHKDLAEEGACSELMRWMPLQLARMCDPPAENGGTYGEYDLDLPPVASEQFNMDKISTPGAADNTMKAVRAMYELAMKRGWTSHSPAKGVKADKQNKGSAKPWPLTT